MAISFLQSDPRSGDGEAPVWQARLFGPFQLTAPDGSNATPAGRKTRALLAFLFATTDDGSTRDRLCGLFYSERSEEQARASLRQLLYEMRALTTGPQPLVVLDPLRVRIAPLLAATDLSRMQALAAADDPSGLAELIGHRPADLLTDLDGIDPGFDEWLAVERARCADERRRIVLEAAERATARGQSAVALRLATGLLARDPTDEVAARLAMFASHRQGDRDRIRTLFTRLKGALRADLGVDPSEVTLDVHRRLSTTPTPEDAAPVDTNSGGVAMRIVDVGSIDHAGLSPTRQSPDAVPAATAYVPPAPQERGATNGPPTGRRRGTIAAAVIGSIVVVLVCAVLALQGHPPRAVPHVLRVDALRTSPGDAAGQALGVGFASTLANLVFANDATLDVIDAGSLARSADRHATFAIDGEAGSDGSHLHVDVRLRRESDGASLWSATFSRPIAEIEALREQMAYRIAGVTLCAAGRQNPTVDAFSLEALRLLFAACAEIRNDDDEVVDHLTKVLERQPDFAHGWAMLAAATKSASGPDSAGVGAGCAAATRFADHALALDPHDGLAYLAKSCPFGALKDWPQRMGVLEQARAAEPANASVLATIAGSLAEIGLVNESVPLSQRAVELAPFDPYKALLHAELLDASGDGPDTKVALQATRRRFPTNADIALEEFRFLAYQGDTKRAAARVEPGAGFQSAPGSRGPVGGGDRRAGGAVGGARCRGLRGLSRQPARARGRRRPARRGDALGAPSQRRSVRRRSRHRPFSIRGTYLPALHAADAGAPLGPPLHDAGDAARPARDLAEDRSMAGLLQRSLGPVRLPGRSATRNVFATAAVGGDAIAIEAARCP